MRTKFCKNHLYSFVKYPENIEIGDILEVSGEGKCQDCKENRYYERHPEAA